MNQNSKYLVHYSIKKAPKGNGEFISYHVMENREATTDSNNLNEIMIDLFDQHRDPGLLGLEIRNVAPLQESSH